VLEPVMTDLFVIVIVTAMLFVPVLGIGMLVVPVMMTLIWMMNF
jgi:hypothetical protein